MSWGAKSSQTPCTAAASPSPRLGAPDNRAAFESACRPIANEAFVLPPLHLDTSPISIQLPLSFCPLTHRLYEAKAPPPLGLPTQLSFAQANEHREEDNQDGDDTTSMSASTGPSLAVSLVALPPSRGESQSPLSASSSITMTPSPSPSPFRASSAPSPPATTPSRATVPRCSPPRSYGYHAFHSPPPSPTLNAGPLPPAVAPPVTANKDEASKTGDAPTPRRPHLPTRRYLARAFVRGETLPFAIVEELDEEDEAEEEAELKARANTSGRNIQSQQQNAGEPETSGSEYSTESAIEVNDGGRVVTKDSGSATSTSRASSASVEGAKSGTRPRRRAGVRAMETRAKRTVSEMSRLTKRMKNLMIVGRGLSVRGRLRL